MSGIDYTEWVDATLRKAKRLTVLFLQLGASHEPARRSLMEANLDWMSVHEYMSHDTEHGQSVLVIDNVESMTNSNANVQMGALREHVFMDVDAGLRVILLSRAPRIAFPAVAGSSLLDDASFAHGPFVNQGGTEQMPTCVEDGAEPAAVLRRALLELGSEVCASLDRVIYENLLVGEAALGLMNARELEALDGAGITTSRGAKRDWNFPKHLVALKRGLDDVLAEQTEPQPQWTNISAGLWKIERLIRRAVRTRAVAAWADNWRSQCLNGDLPALVLDRATESAYLGATSLKQVRDPLEWLTLGELLSLKERKEIGDLGLKAAMWRQFATQIMPIRNRLAHLRTLRPEDSAEVVKWLRVIELKLMP